MATRKKAMTFTRRARATRTRRSPAAKTAPTGARSTAMTAPRTGINYDKFKGTLPYASELFGVYQPLLGWKSKLTIDRMNRGEEMVFRSYTDRALARAGADVIVERNSDGTVSNVKNLVVPDVVSTHSVPRVAREILSIAALVIAKRLPVDHKPSAADWKTFLSRDAVLNPQLLASRAIVEQYFFAGVESRYVIDVDVVAYLNEATAQRPGAERPTSEVEKQLLDREVSVSAYLHWLSQNKPEILDGLFYRDVTNPFQEISTYRDPLSTFGQNELQAVLSPIGLVHLFRQYFFEFDSFLGPAVGHIWLAPGTTLELVEQTTRRTSTERTVELSTESTTKAETSEAIREELATAVREENRSDVKFGFGASFNYHNGTVDAGAHTDLSLDNARSSARDTTHKQMREQTQRISNEIRKSFKTTFKTTTETTQSTGRRYVLQNNTTDLINYELRRKMRQIGVQAHDIGTQLCWQVFVDDPGKALGLAQLLHIAAPPELDGLHAPEAPARLEPKTVEVSLQFPYERDPSSQGDGETDVLYIEGDDQEHIGGTHNIGYNDKIFFRRQYTLVPPAPGYTLAEQFTMRTDHPGPVSAEIKRLSKTDIEVILHQVNFVNQPFVQLQVTALWNPDPAQQKALDDAYATQLTQYDAERSAAEREAMLKAARERIKLASQIRGRRFEDLREEERIVVYRQLIGQLMAVGESQHQDEHVTSELIRAIFDVDKMLYFVAPEWWRARRHDQGARLNVGTDRSTLVSGRDLVGWENPRAMGRNDNYLITEESDPAPLGSSLGWLLQLDGDDLRNAFLNSPWVKAIIPIRPGREEAALNWLTLAHVAGADGLDSAYDAPAAELRKIKDGLAALGRGVGDTVTVRDALLFLANDVQRQYKEATTAKPSPFDPHKNVIPTEVVFEHGFDPLRGGFEVDIDPTRVFSQWAEVLPTDQVVAVPYDAAKHT